MNDFADEVRDDGTLMFVSNDEPVILNIEEELAQVQTCDYCGHYPCGCGG